MRASLSLRPGSLRAAAASACIALHALTAAGCDSGSGGDADASAVLKFTEMLTGSILVVPIQQDLSVDYGFGLYSTILFSGPDTQRNSLFLRALSRTVPAVRLEDTPPEVRARRNAFFLPTNIGFVNFCLPEGGDRLFETLASRPETQIDFFEVIYGHDLANSWLNSLQDQGLHYGEGPVLVISPAPIGKIVDGETLVIVVDLSGKSPKLFEKYIELILDEVRKPEVWRKQSIDDLSLGMAELVVSIDDSVASAFDAVRSFISVVRAAQSGEIPGATATGLSDSAQSACNRLRAALPEN